MLCLMIDSCHYKQSIIKRTERTLRLLFCNHKAAMLVDKTIFYMHTFFPLICMKKRICSQFTKSFRKIRLESKWNTTFWVIPAENFPKQRNTWTGSPVFPDGLLQTKIRVPFLQGHLWYQFQAFTARFWSMELNCTMIKAIPGWNLPVPNFAYHWPKPWTDQFARVNDKQPGFLRWGTLLFLSTNMAAVTLAVPIREF